jgi:hypothetical protein
VQGCGAGQCVGVLVPCRFFKVKYGLTKLAQFNDAIIVCKVLAHSLAWHKHGQLTIAVLQNILRQWKRI